MTSKLIHVAEIQLPQKGKVPLYLREISPHEYRWFQVSEAGEKKTDVVGITIEEALKLAHRHFRHDYFRTLNCGFRYTLPERDEHGMNALFHQLAASHSTLDGVYFDEELGHNCTVQNASQEAIKLLKNIKTND